MLNLERPLTHLTHLTHTRAGQRGKRDILLAVRLVAFCLRPESQRNRGPIAESSKRNHMTLHSDFSLFFSNQQQPRETELFTVELMEGEGAGFALRTAQGTYVGLSPGKIKKERKRKRKKNAHTKSASHLTASAASAGHGETFQLGVKVESTCLYLLTSV